MPPLSALVPEDEFLWAASRVALHADRLSQFAVYFHEASELVLGSQLREALKLLDHVEEHFGKSLWAIKLRMALLQRVDGFEAQKRYAMSILQSNTNQFVKFIVHYVSIRNESALSPGSFRSMYERHREAQPGTDDVEAYGRFHILPKLYLSSEDCAWVLNLEDAGSLIDLYEALLGLTAQLHALDQEAFQKVALPGLRLLSDRITDRRLTSLTSSLNGKWTSLSTHVSQATFEQFLGGFYKDAALSARNALERGAPLWEFVDLLARASASVQGEIPAKTDLLWMQIAAHMQALLVKDDRAAEGSDELWRVAMNFDGLSWANAVSGFLREEAGGEINRQAAHVPQGALTPPLVLHPMYALTLSRELGKLYLDCCEHVFGETLTVRYNRELLGDTVPFAGCADLSKEAALLARSEWSLTQGDAESALALSRGLSADAGASPYFRNRAIRVVLESLISLDRLEECVSVATGLYVANHNLHPLLSTRELANRIDKGLRRKLFPDVSLAILFDMYAQYEGSELDARRRVAFQELLQAHGLSRPSQLANVLDRFERPKLLYFLRRVCVPAVFVPAVISGVFVFNSSQEVEDERVAICQLLNELDSERSEEYQAEIKAITTSQAVQGGIKQVNDSKIYVDLDGVRKAADKNLRESFNRYRTFAESNVDQMIQEVMQALRKARAGDDTEVVTLRLPKGEASDILQALIEDLRDEFVSNTQYGLDGYLSQRVRHGTLQGHLRSPLEAEKLITQQEAGSNRYRPNTYWAEQLLTSNEKVKNAVAHRLALFSQEFDGLVTRIRTEWIQIRRTENERGLFDFRVSPALARLIATSFSHEATFEEFVDTAIEFLWKQLDEKLTRVRNAIQTDAKKEFDRLLEKLKDDISSSTYGIGDGDLLKVIVSARTAMQPALDRMAEWFRLPTETSSHPLPLSLAERVAEETINRFHPGFNLRTICETSEDPVYPRPAWVSFVDVFLILFENIVKHCGISSSPSVTVQIRAAKETVDIRVTNQIAPGVRTAEARARITKIKEEMERGDYQQAVSREGGSGFHKIRKIIGEEFNSLRDMKCGFENDQEFAVEISMKRNVVDASLADRG